MSFGEEQIIEFMKMLSGEKEVQDLFSYDKVPTAEDRSAVNIDKKQRKIQELQNAYDRTENAAKRTVQQAKLVNARKALAKLVVSEQTRRIRQGRDVKAAEEANETRTKTNKGVKRPRTSTKAHSRAQEDTKFKKSRWEQVPLDAWRKMSRVVAETLFVFFFTCSNGGQAQRQQIVSWPIGTSSEKPRTCPPQKKKKGPHPNHS